MLPEVESWLAMKEDKLSTNTKAKQCQQLLFSHQEPQHLYVIFQVVLE